MLLKHAVAISMDGKGAAWRDNVLVERLMAQRQI
ncbi:Integrase (fragment) [Methylocella tundrae]|uniref:Integrase n=1 Tax=Methylocella tundrae TaxID=227605 RepID=A0A4U8Z0F2_METTU